MPDNYHPVNSKLLRLIPPMGIALILGSEGSGKSNLGYGILESLKDSGRKVVVYGLPLEKSIYLPDWVSICNTVDFPEESIVLADEAYMQWHSRGSMSNSNKFMDLFSGLVRQKDILAIYITQFSRKLDIGLVSSPRVLLIKQPSLLQMRLDRSELRPIISDAYYSFKKLEIGTQLPHGAKKEIEEIKHRFSELGTDTAVDPRCLIATYVVSDRFEGMIDMSNRSPSFWSKELSKAWKGISLIEGEIPVFQRGSPILCVLCDKPAIGTCSCHGNSYCEDHAEGHIIAGKR